MRAAVIGSGAWGTALSIQLCQKSHDTVLWFRNPDKAAAAAESRQNPALPGIALPDDLRVSSDPGCVRDCDLVVIACPSFPIRSVCQTVAPYLPQGAVLASATKGIEPGTHLRMSQILQEVTGHTAVALTGPSHAEEVARGIPTGCLAACADRQRAEFVQDAFMSDTFRVYTSPDVVGAELGGALKNVIALCAGISDGLGNGDNTKAMLMTRGLTEMARLGVAMGAQKDTFAGLAGVGDLIVTCTSMHSRNRRAGILIGKGVPAQEALSQVGAVVEGYFAAKSAYELCRSLGVNMPIVEAAYSVLYENCDARTAVRTLLMRQKKAEQEDAGWLS
ncbi:MAG: NAD(P)-dependent glycerol-3-phosphate dehydrogenase [Firmicutes bacterium]|nr:NAD(P)-dependent glycerol-3-phosphate dehydrogenase [Bacillota bacterium]